jgi:hypothetical protein
MNGIHEVTGSIPVRSTNLRSPVLRWRLSTKARNARRWTHSDARRASVGKPTFTRRIPIIVRRSAEG